MDFVALLAIWSAFPGFGVWTPLNNSQMLKISSKMAIGESNQYGSTGEWENGKQRTTHHADDTMRNS
jgi:hypothetical protein